MIIFVRLICHLGKNMRIPVLLKLPRLIIFLASVLWSHPVRGDEAMERKARSIEILKAEGVPYIAHLPEIETVEDSIRRTEEEVIQRLIALVIVAAKAETGDNRIGKDLVEEFGAEGFFTADEHVFMADVAPSESHRIQFSWRYEAVHVLLWSIGIINDIGRPDTITDVPVLASILRDLGTDGLRRKAQLRTQADILDASDLIYRYHWAVREEHLNRAVASSLDPRVIYERHYALNWLIGYAGQEWDDISTDT